MLIVVFSIYARRRHSLNVTVKSPREARGFNVGLSSGRQVVDRLMERIKLKVMMAMIVLNPVLSGVTREEPGVFPSAPKDYVVLLHGLGRTSLSMKRLEWTLKKENYRVVNLGYPSTRLSIQEIADGRLEETLSRQVTDRSAKVHFVTHSLGGIVLRQYLSDHKIENLGRVVMLAPPNQGSELADRLKASCLYRFFTGPSGQQLGTDAFSVPKRLGPADFALGIVAGDRSLNPIFSAWIPGPDDGKVSVRSTQLDGMQDFLVVHHSHTWMAWNKTVNAAVVQLLKTGRFQPAGLKSQGARAGGSSETSKVDPRPRIPQLE